VSAEFEERDGKPVAVKLNFGPGMESTSAVTAWEPPQKWATQSDGWVPGSPPIANEWSIEARGGGICIARIVQSLFASTDDWDNQLEGAEYGWPGFLRTLRIYLTHFRGQRSAAMKWMAPVAGTEAEAWETLTAALGVNGLSVGQRWTAPAGVPALGGVAKYGARTTSCCGSTRRGRASPPLEPSTWAVRAWLRWASTFTAIRRPEPSPTRHRSGKRGFKNASQCRQSRARATNRVVRSRRRHRQNRRWDLNHVSLSKQRSSVTSPCEFDHRAMPFEHARRSVTRVLTMKKPFDVLAEGLISKNDRVGGI